MNINRATITPAVNQIEAHPYFQQPELLEWLNKMVSVSMYLVSIFLC